MCCRFVCPFCRFLRPVVCLSFVLFCLFVWCVRSFAPRWPCTECYGFMHSVCVRVFVPFSVCFLVCFEKCFFFFHILNLSVEPMVGCESLRSRLVSLKKMLNRFAELEKSNEGPNRKKNQNSYLT